MSMTPRNVSDVDQDFDKCGTKFEEILSSFFDCGMAIELVPHVQYQECMLKRLVSI